METLNLNVNLENLTTEERDALMKLVEKSQEKKSKVWKPSELYWTFNGSVFHDNWMDNDIDNARYESGNCFETKEEAEEELTRRKMITKWKRLSIEAGEEENEWNNTNKHWIIQYSYENQALEANYVIYNRNTDIYFPFLDALSNAVHELGEENVKKYILGVRY